MKARTEGQKRRDKKARSMFDLAPTPKRQPNGQKRERADKNPRETVLIARCRHMGMEPGDEQQRSVNFQRYEGQAGLAINKASVSKQEAERLWDAFSTIDAAEEVYFRRVLQRSRFAKTAKIEMMPDPFEIRPDDKPDLRSDDDKDRDATNRWMHYRGYIGMLMAHEQQALFDALFRRCDLMRDGGLTTAGASFVASLRTITEFMDA